MSALALVQNHTDTITSHVARAVIKLDSAPIAVLLVFALSPMILCGNSLILSALYRFKRLRTPSNYLLASLASSDLGVGLFLPAGMYLELTESGPCLVAYCIIITLCCASIIVMCAISVDRFTSLSQPLRYNNLITHTSMQRYLIVFWLYATIIGFSPLSYIYIFHRDVSGDCTFNSLVEKRVQLFLLCTVYGPCCLIVIICYSYIYVVARYHARAIYTVELSLRQNIPDQIAGSRYGQTLAITVGLFLTLWLPFQICMLLDIIRESVKPILNAWTCIYLSLPIFASSAVNPWVYGYRNSEIRTSVQRVLEEILGKLGFASSHYDCPEVMTVNGENAEMNSFASNIRLCATSPNRTTMLLIPARNNDFLDPSTALTIVRETGMDSAAETLLESSTNNCVEEIENTHCC